jgi:hypothetical protein
MPNRSLDTFLSGIHQTTGQIQIWISHKFILHCSSSLRGCRSSQTTEARLEQEVLHHLRYRTWASLSPWGVPSEGYPQTTEI